VPLIFSVPFPVRGTPTGCWGTSNRKFYWGSPIENSPTPQQIFIYVDHPTSQNRDAKVWIGQYANRHTENCIPGLSLGYKITASEILLRWRPRPLRKTPTRPYWGNNIGKKLMRYKSEQQGSSQVILPTSSTLSLIFSDQSTMKNLPSRSWTFLAEMTWTPLWRRRIISHQFGGPEIKIKHITSWHDNSSRQRYQWCCYGWCSRPYCWRKSHAESSTGFDKIDMAWRNMWLMKKSSTLVCCSCSSCNKGRHVWG
jgi:hypothetical protein